MISEAKFKKGKNKFFDVYDFDAKANKKYGSARVGFKNPTLSEYQYVRIDGDLIQDNSIRKCDYLVETKANLDKEYAYYIELKGSSFLDARQQLMSTAKIPCLNNRHKKFKKVAIIAIASETWKYYSQVVKIERSRANIKTSNKLLLSDNWWRPYYSKHLFLAPSNLIKCKDVDLLSASII